MVVLLIYLPIICGGKLEEAPAIMEAGPPAAIPLLYMFQELPAELPKGAEDRPEFPE